MISIVVGKELGHATEWFDKLREVRLPHIQHVFTCQLQVNPFWPGRGAPSVKTLIPLSSLATRVSHHQRRGLGESVTPPSPRNLFGPEYRVQLSLERYHHSLRFFCLFFV